MQSIWPILHGLATATHHQSLVGRVVQGVFAVVTSHLGGAAPDYASHDGGCADVETGRVGGPVGRTHRHSIAPPGIDPPRGAVEGAHPLSVRTASPTPHPTLNCAHPP